jgi:hypothetical protein
LNTEDQQLNGGEEPVDVQEERGQLAQVDLLGLVQEHGATDGEDEQLPEHADDL